MQCKQLDNPWAPQSPLFHVKQTPDAGRGVFASADISAGTVLLEADDLSTSTIHRDYRKEVCAFCFAYDRGVNWPIREAAAGFSFCAEECRLQWRAFVRDDGLQAYEAIETLSKKKKQQQQQQQQLNEDSKTLEDIPTVQEIEQAWADASTEGSLLTAARTSPRPSKLEKRALREALEVAVEPSVLSYLLSGVLTAARVPEDRWSSITVLHANPTPYPTHETLHQHLASYLHLLAVVPSNLLPWTTAEICYTLATRNAQNAFGLRSLDDGGDEVFGYGDWPTASYWNHSCVPNVGKRRVGRVWRFCAQRDVRRDEQLCITYLGGDERVMGAKARRARLAGEWGFHCLCCRCDEDDRVSRSNTG